MSVAAGTISINRRTADGTRQVHKIHVFAKLHVAPVPREVSKREYRYIRMSSGSCASFYFETDIEYPECLKYEDKFSYFTNWNPHVIGFVSHGCLATRRLCRERRDKDRDEKIDRQLTKWREQITAIGVIFYFRDSGGGGGGGGGCH